MRRFVDFVEILVVLTSFVWLAGLAATAVLRKLNTILQSMTTVIPQTKSGVGGANGEDGSDIR